MPLFSSRHANFDGVMENSPTLKTLSWLQNPDSAQRLFSSLSCSRWVELLLSENLPDFEIWQTAAVKFATVAAL